MYSTTKPISVSSMVLGLVFLLTIFSYSKGVDLPFNPNNCNFLIYDPGTGSNIKEAMRIILGRELEPNEIRTSIQGNQVTAADLQNHDILIVGWNQGGDMTGLHSDVLASGITGRIVLTGHDADLHTIQRNFYAQTMLIQAINYILQDSNTGLICLADTANFSYLPKTQWRPYADYPYLALPRTNRFTI